MAKTFEQLSEFQKTVICEVLKTAPKDDKWWERDFSVEMKINGSTVDPFYILDLLESTYNDSVLEEAHGILEDKLSRIKYRLDELDILIEQKILGMMEDIK